MAKPFILILALASLAYAARALGLGGRIEGLRDWIKSLGFWGPAVFAGIYAAAVTALVPGSAITIAAGALFGTVKGVITVSIASTAGAALSFLIARYFAREPVEKWLKKNEKFGRLDELTEKNGAAIVAITRLVPLFPYTLLNYAFGLTKVKFYTYLFWSWLCMLPGTVLYVAGSDAAFRAISAGSMPPVAAGAFVLFAVLLVVLVRYARDKLKSVEDQKYNIKNQNDYNWKKL